MAKDDLITLMTSYGEGNAIHLQFWLWDASHHRVKGWDGRSPLGIDLDKAMQNAIAWVEAKQGGTFRIKSVELTEEQDPYLSIDVEPVTDDEDDISWHTLVCDLKGTVIEPQERTFKTEKAYDKFHDQIYAEHGMLDDDDD